MTRKRSQTSPLGSPSSGNISNTSSKEQDRFLPIANVSRIMKKSHPANAKIPKDAKETVQECVSEFISFITGEASDKCQREKRKTINGDDLLWAMTTLGFENYVGPLKIYLNNYRETEGEKSQEDHSFPSANIISQVGDEIGKLTNYISTRSDLQGFHEEGYDLGSEESYGGRRGKANGRHGESLVGGVFSVGKTHELGDGNVNRARATHLHHEGNVRLMK